MARGRFGCEIKSVCFFKFPGDFFVHGYLSLSLSLSLSLFLSFSLLLVDVTMEKSLRSSYTGLCPQTLKKALPPWTLQYIGTPLIRNRAPLGPYSMTMPMAIQWSRGGSVFDERGTPVCDT